MIQSIKRRKVIQMRMNNKMTKSEEKMLKLWKMAAEVVILEDKKLLKELAKY